MKRVILASSTLLVAAVAGAGLFLFSPAACSCAERWMALASEAGLYEFAGRDELTAARLEAGLNRSLAGSRMNAEQNPTASTDTCSPIDLHSVSCRVPVEQSLFLVRGYEVTYRYAADGSFERASVVALTWRH